MLPGSMFSRLVRAVWSDHAHALSRKVICEQLEPRRLLCSYAPDAEHIQPCLYPGICNPNGGNNGSEPPPGPGDPTQSDPPPNPNPNPNPNPQPPTEPPQPPPPPLPPEDPDPEPGWHVNLVVMDMDEETEVDPGGFMPVNSDFDEKNKDSSGTFVPDTQPNNTTTINGGHRIVTGDAELRFATLYVSGPSEVEEAAWTITFPAKVKLWIWRAHPICKWESINSGHRETSELPAAQQFIVEGISPSQALRDVTITASLDGEGGSTTEGGAGDGDSADGGGAALPGGSGASDTVKLTLVDVDTDVDSDNNNGTDDPARTHKEEHLEDKANEPGKILSVNDGDVDGDGIPDFADGYSLVGGGPNAQSLEGVTFVPYILDLRGVPNSELVRIRFIYSASHPWHDSPTTPGGVVRTGSGTPQDPYVWTPGPGYLRLWTRNANERTTEGPLRNNGQYVAPNIDYVLGDFGEDRPVESRPVEIEPGVYRLWLEAVRPIEVPADQLIKVEIDPDAWEPGGHFETVATDAVRVMAVGFHIAVDRNRDGDITFDAFDATKESSAYRFWINDDVDGSVTISDFPGNNLFGSTEVDYDLFPGEGLTPRDKDDTVINVRRDLEDFTRLHIDLRGLVDGLYDQVQLQFTDLIMNTNPKVRLWRAARSDDQYLRNGNFAQQQIDVSNQLQRYILVSDQATTLVASGPAGFDDKFTTLTEPGHMQFAFLLEGVSEGAGALTVRFLRSQQVVGEAKAHLDLHRVWHYYEHFSADSNSNPGPDHRASGSVMLDPSNPDDGDADYILFVHGWNMPPFDRKAFAETAFKRLFWQGYKGRFGVFSWPTEWLGPSWYSGAEDPQNYDRSEEKAYQSAPVLREVLVDLQTAYPGRVRLVSHSMGAVVASEALRQQGASFGQQFVHTYVASQASTVGNAYDAAVPWRGAPVNGWETPDVYSSYFTPAQLATGSIMSFFNQQDWALSPQVWERNQDWKPDVGRGGYDVNPATQLHQFYRLDGNERIWLTLDNLNDRYYIYSYLAEAHTTALGRTSGARGIVTAEVDLAATLGFGNLHWWHSGQFNSDIMTTHAYWATLLATFGIATA